jgi:hypothetical protein
MRSTWRVATHVVSGGKSLPVIAKGRCFGVVSTPKNAMDPSSVAPPFASRRNAR